MYYALVITAAVLFGLQFFFNKLYQRQNGSGLRSATIFALGTSLVCAAAMLCIQKFRIEFSAYSFYLAVLSAIILIAYIFCSIKAMEKISLSLYTMFGMLGGMVLPFLVGVFGYGEELTAKKILSAVLVLFALTIGTDYKAGGKAIFYGIAVFFLNGLIGVLSTVHQAKMELCVSSASFMFLKSILTAAICLCLLIFFRKPKQIDGRKTSFVKTFISVTGYGIMNGIGNWLVLVALNFIDASLQYTLLTGGTILVSAVISFLMKEKFTLKAILSVIVAFGATVVTIF